MNIARGFILVLAVLVAGAIALLPAGCGDGRATVPSKGRPKVVATVGMIADVAREIAGDRASVTGLMGEGVDPHLYKASPGDIRLLDEADLVLYNGLLLEGRMVDVLVKMAARRPTVAVTERLDAGQLREPEEMKGHADPHVWFDVSLWRRAAERIRDALIELDPSGREHYRVRAEAYMKALDELHEWCGRELARVPRERRVLITAHDAFGYFGRAYDVEVRAIQGVSTDSEASVRAINELVRIIVERRIGAVFVESSVPPKTVEALVEGCRARGHMVRVGGELFSDALGPAGTPEGTYIGMVRHNVNTIVNALLPEGDGRKGG
ncbi:MAG: metal ABC transporter solute-binding protein, Zn/Mn family [Phycisphaerales bacterium]